MSISVVCQKCGKALKVKDEWRGKRAKCPGCGEMFVVGGPAVGGTAVAMPAAGVPGGGTVFNHNAAAAAKAQREKAAGSFAVSPGLIVGAIAVLLLCTLVGWFLAGPKKVWNQWEAMGDKPKDTVIDVVTRGLQCYFQGIGIYNPRKDKTAPEAKSVIFYRPTMVMNMPDGVDFQGGSNVGLFKGVYHPKTGEVEATVAVGGGIGIPGSGGKKTTGMNVKITGNENNGKLTTFVNGTKVDLVMPPLKPDDQ